MNKTLSLLKIILKETYSFSKMNKKSKISSMLMFAFVGIFAFFYVVVYTNMGIDYLSVYGYEKSIPVIAYIVSSILIIAFGFSTTKNILFESKDNDLLLSMPVKDSQIFTARTLSIMILNYGISILVFFVCNICMYFKLELDIKYLLFSILLTLFIPLIPTIIAVLIGYIIAVLTNKMKNPKLFETIINFTIVALVFITTMLISNEIENFMESVAKIKEFFAGPGYFIKTIYLTLANYDIFAFFTFSLISVGVFALSVLIFSFVYKNIIYKSQKNVVNNNKTVDYKKENKASSLLKKEFKLYISSPNYVVNTFFGVLLFIMFTVYIAVTKGNGIYKMISSGEMPEFPMVYIVLIVVTFVICMSNTACASISIEGKRLWILKTIPVELKTIIDSKIVFNILIVAPICIICSVIMGFVLNFGAVQMLLVCMYILMLTYSIAMFGIICNIKFPKLDWQNEVQVVKQSMSTFSAMMGSMLFSMTFTGIFMVLCMSFGEVIALAILDLMYIIVCLVINRILYLKSLKKFYINC